MREKPIAMVLLTVAFSVMMSLGAFADVEDLLQPGEVTTVYDGLRSSAGKYAVPQGSVSYALRYQERFLPRDLRDYEYVSYGDVDLYGDRFSVGPRTIRGSPGISFGFPPSAVRVAPRLGVIQHVEQKGVTPTLLSQRRIGLRQVRLTEVKEESSQLCCNRRILNIWNVEAWHLGGCDLMKLKKTAGEVEANRLVKAACGSHPGYRYAPCMTTNDVVCTAPSMLP
ncbi:hypothetical protein HY641_00810 [Candidatus Woesearchaeota archaeon]|nr:hypothetical protein [Candidatus Woesearchaeota archaeon]